MIKYILCLALLMSCSTRPQSSSAGENYQLRRGEFLGYWIGEKAVKNGKFARWLVERRIDGAFTFTLMIKDSPQDPRRFDPEKATYELGTWGVSGDIYFTATRQYYEKGKIANFDTTDPTLYDAYKIIFFDGNTMIYRGLDSGEEFTMRKIPKDQPVEL